MKLYELIEFTDWQDVQLSITHFYGDFDHHIMFFFVFMQLEQMTPVDADMRIVVIETPPEELDEEYDITHEVIGRNGKLNCDFEGYEFLEGGSDPEFCNAEADFNLSMTSWDKWLGMDVDEGTLRQYKYSHIIALSIFKMVLNGYNLTEILDDRESYLVRLREIIDDSDLKSERPLYWANSKRDYEKLISF